MLKIDEIVKRLKDRNLATVARQSGVSYTSLWQIANNLQTHPKYKNIEKLSDYLESME